MYLARREPTGLSWILLTLCFTVPWLIPAHTEPWPTLYSEVASGLVLLPLAIWLLAKHKTFLKFDFLAVGFFMAALVPPLQAAAGLFIFPTEALVISIYLAGFSLVVVIARCTEDVLPGRLPDTLFSSLFIAALVSTGLALAQWLHQDWGPLLAGIPGGGTRTVANIGQTNELSTLLVWGLIGLWWAYLHQRVSGGVAVFAAGFILIGVASTQSRTGWIAAGIVLMTAFIAPRSLGLSKNRYVFAGLGIWFLLLVLSWPTATGLIESGNALSLKAQLSAGIRPDIWSMMIDGIIHRPWVGYGWNQGRLVQLNELPNYAELKVGVQHAHNLVLDLMVWNGVPLGLSFVTLLGAWFWWQMRRATTAEQMLLLLALSTFTLHTMLELPHCKAFFLMPAALMMGTLNARSGLIIAMRVKRYLVILGVIVIAIALVLTWVDYRRIEVDLQAYRMRMAWSGIKPAPPEPDIYILNGLQSALVNLRIEPKANMDSEVLERLRITATRYPIESVLFKYAKAAALNGNTKAAQESLRRWCLLFSKDRCDVAKNAWSDFLDEHPEILKVPFPSRF